MFFSFLSLFYAFSGKVKLKFCMLNFVTCDLLVVQVVYFLVSGQIIKGIILSERICYVV